MTSEPRRLHPAAIVVEAVASALQLLLSVVVLSVVGRGGALMVVLLGLGGLAVATGVGIARWRATSYRLDEVALRLTSGVFSPDEQLVPRARVTAVDTAAGPVQRLFGVVELHVQTAGGASEDDVRLTAVTRAEAARLRAALGQPEPAEPSVAVRLGLRGLLLAALTGPQVGAAVSVVAALFTFGDDVVDLEESEGLVASIDSVGSALVVLALVLGGGYLLSFLGAIVAFAGFVAERDGDVLRIRRGLLRRQVQSVPLARVDGVTVVEGVLRGAFGVAALRLETAAHGEEAAAGKTLLPLVRRSQAEDVIASLVPTLVSDPGPLLRPSTSSLRRFVFAPCLIGAGAGAVVVGVEGGELWWVVALLVLLGGLWGFRAWRACGVRLAGEVVVVREALLSRRTLVARRGRLQEHALSATPLQARGGVADLRLAVGSGRAGRARHLDAAVARDLFAALRP